MTLSGSTERRSIATLRLFGAALLFALACGCSGAGKFVWYTELSKAEWGVPADNYLIGVGDSIKISVYQQEGFSESLKIRRDGRISVPLVGEMVAAGKTPAGFAQELETHLKKYLVAPKVTVNVEQSQPITVTTMGEFTNRGTYSLEPPAWLVQAVAQAGGLSDYGDAESIFVLRQIPKFQRIRFTYEAILRNEEGAAAFPLRTGDVIVAE